MKTYFQIGEIEKISGLNAQTIRRYDKKGILQGMRDESNGYRYYDEIELCMAIRVHLLKNAEFSVSGIEQYICGDVQTQLEMTRAQADVLRRQRTLLDHKIAYLEEQDALMRRYQEDPEWCELCERPAMRGTFYRRHGEIVREGDYIARMTAWLGCMPVVRPMFAMNSSLFYSPSHPKEIYNIGLWMEAQHSHLFDLPGDDTCFELPRQMYIHTIFDGYGAVSSRPESLERAARCIGDFARREGLRPTGEITYGSTICSCRTGNGLHHLANLWVPVEKK